MKLIKKGTKHQRSFKTECRNCGSQFEEQNNKLKWEHDRDGDLAREKCSECGHEIFFYKNTPATDSNER